jgi:ABC-type glycerol-3-phosphate transport system substrate-binding protein
MTFGRKNARRILFLLLLFILIVVPCRAVEIVHLMSSSNGLIWQQFLEETARKYEALHPDIKIDLQYVPSAQYLDVITVRAASGVSVDAYQLYPSIATQIIESGLVMDLQPFFAADKDVKLADFVPFAVEAFTYNGMLWGFPSAAYPLINFYNIDMYLENGLRTPNELGKEFTWEQFVDAAKKMTKDDNGDGVTDRYGVFTNNDLWRWFVYVNQAGGQVLNSLNNPDKSLFLTASARTGLKFFIDLFQTHHVAPQEFAKWAVATTFPKGLIGNVPINSSSFVSTINQTPGVNYDVSELPHGPDNNATAIFMSAYQISSTSRHPQETWEWIKFVAVELENARNFVRATGRVPVLRRLLGEYENLLPGSPPHMYVLQNMLVHPKVQLEYLSPVANEIRSTTNSIVLQAIRGNIAVETALEQIDAQVTNLLAEVKRK